MKARAVFAIAASILIQGLSQPILSHEKVQPPGPDEQIQAPPDPPAPAPLLKAGTATVTIPTNTMADQWVEQRTEPFWQQHEEACKKKAHPVRSLVKCVGANYHHAAVEMGKDMAFVFSSDWAPDEHDTAPIKKPAIILEMNLVDGSTAYVWRFPDDSYAIQGGFADNTVIVPIRNERNEYLCKYPNGVTGRILRQGTTTKIYRPDHSVTTISRTQNGHYRIANDKIGYMGEAHTDPTGLQYELGSWTHQNDQDM